MILKSTIHSMGNGLCSFWKALTGREKSLSYTNFWKYSYPPFWYFCTSFWIFSVGERDALMERSWFRALMIAAIYLLMSASR